MRFKKILYRILCVLPHDVFIFLSKIVLSKADAEWLEKERIKTFALTLVDDFDSVCKKICKKKRIMVISKGMFGYTYLNNAYITNVMALIVYALYRGYIPEIRINSEESDSKNNWDWYFIQPMKLPCFADVDFSKFRRIECNVVGSRFSPWMDILWNKQSDDYRIWRFLYKKLLQFNEKTKEYFRNELADLDGNNTLGTLIRGTDYTATKPKYHPIQPELNDLIAAVKTEYETGKYNKIYVATEEKKIFNAMVEVFGEDKVLTKQKVFYDEIYYQNFKNNITRIGDVKFARENDNYLKGIEYLLTLNALSSCSAIIGGNCGGTMYAVLMSDDDCKHDIFNLGVY